MHGKGQRGSELCRRLIGGQHMPVTTTTTVAVGDSSVVSTITADSFCKVLPWMVAKLVWVIVLCSNHLTIPLPSLE